MNRIFVTVLAGWVLLAAGSAIAGKVNMPKEGGFEFDYCAVGQGKGLSAGDKYAVSHYQNVANVTTNPPGKPFDRTGSVCFGTYANVNGRQWDYGMCELTDEDGDKWWLEYRGNAEGTGGTYTAAYGNGKYEGMTVRGEYRLDFWPTASKDVAFQGCFHNKGTYKLK